MLQVSKKTVGQWLLLSLLAEQRELLERNKQFEAKYGLILNDFEKKLHQQEQENFSQWDDFIDWKSINTALEELRTKINDIENGAIRLVD